MKALLGRVWGNGTSVDFNTPNPRYESTPTDVGPIMLTCEDCSQKNQQMEPLVEVLSLIS